MPAAMCPAAHSYCARVLSPTSDRLWTHRSTAQPTVPFPVRPAPRAAAADAATAAAQRDG